MSLHKPLLLKDKVRDRMDNKLRYLAKIDEDIIQAKKHIQEWKQELDKLQGAKDTIVLQITDEMIECGCTSSDVDGVRWSIRNNPPKVIITSESDLPEKYIRVKTIREPNKVLLKTALQKGTVSGAMLSNGSVSLTAKGI